MTTMEFRDGSSSCFELDDDLLIFDRENAEAWTQSDAHVRRIDAR